MNRTWIRLFFIIAISVVTVMSLLFFFPNHSLSAKTSIPSQRTRSSIEGEIDISLDDIVATGFDRPVQITHAGDGSGRLFVIEKIGRIRLIENGTLLPTPFLDITSQVNTTNWEQGLLGLAFHPDYEENGSFYVNYTNLDDDTVVARYSVSDDPNIAAPNSAFTILTVEQPEPFHNGGQLAFGPLDGYLYIALGDGGLFQSVNGQDTTQLLGKILRIDLDTGNNEVPYVIPPSNPFTQTVGYRDEIWAFGLRNPWRFSFDRETGDLYIGDVGFTLWEEVDYQASSEAAGLNFAWSCKEGTHNWKFTEQCGSANLVEPIVEYNHDEGSAITGGFVYRGKLFPALVGHYFYADFMVGKLWSVYKTAEDSWSTPDLELDTDFRISSFGEDEEGELYVVDYDGTIRRLMDANIVGFDLSSSTKSVSTPHADAGERVSYTISLRNTALPVNQSFTLVDEIPAGLTYIPGTFNATAGTIDAQEQALQWEGSFDVQNFITITYDVLVTGEVTGTLINEASLTAPAMSPISLTSALFTPRPLLTTTVNDFFFPGTQPNQLNISIPTPAQCQGCHTEPIYDQWRGSMMGQAGRDPLMWAALYVANNDAPEAGEYCLRCHTPKGWLEGRSEPTNGSALLSGDIESGVACEVCHRMVDPIPSEDDQTVEIDEPIRKAIDPALPLNHVGSAMMIIDPNDNRRGPFEIDIPYHTTNRSDFLGQSSSHTTRSRLCGTCHNLDNPTLSWDSERNQYWPNEVDTPTENFANGQLFPVERTYDEWLHSEYASEGVYAPQFAGDKPDGIVGACQDCHMPRSTGFAAQEVLGAIERDCSTTGCLPVHQLVGGNTWVPELLQDTRWRLNSADDATLLNNTILSAREMLQKAATMTVTLSMSDTNKIATVRVTNETGHKLPTGYPEGRRMWINLKGYNAKGEVVYESGAYNANTGVLTQDETIKVYETKHGLTPELAKQLELPAGESFHFALNNVILKDNRIPPRGYTQAAYAQPGLEPIGASYADGQHWDETTYNLPLETTNITATLYYQTSSKEYIDFLRENGGADGIVVGEMWDSSKSPPEVMSVATVASPTTVPSTPTASPTTVPSTPTASPTTVPSTPTATPTTAPQYGLYLPLVVR